MTRRPTVLHLTLTGLLTLGGVVVAGPAGSAPAAPTCDGRPATIVGTPGDDRLQGTDERDVVVARGGDDVVVGASTSDVLCGGRGDDTLLGGDDADHLFGGRGDDVLVGGFDAYFREPTDRYIGDELVGGPGSDEISGDLRRQGSDDGDGYLFGVDVLSYADSSDPVVGDVTGSIDGRRGVLADGPSRDTVYGVDQILGSRADDDVRGVSLVYGGPGADTVGGSVRASGGPGRDVVLAQGYDSVGAGGDGRDVMRAVGRRSRVNGGADHDRLVSSRLGSAVLAASPGADDVVGGPGDEQVVGRGSEAFGDVSTGGGADQVSLGRLPASLDLGRGANRLDLASVRPGGLEDAVLRVDLAGRTVRLGPDSLRFRGEARAVVGARRLPNRLDGTPRGERLVGGNQADRITGGGGPDRLSGVDGDDVLLASDDVADDTTADGGRGRDTCRAVTVDRCEGEPD